MPTYQVILVPATPDDIGRWVEAATEYMKLFRGVTVSSDPSPGNLRLCDVVTIVGGADEWGYDITARVRDARPDVKIDYIRASTPEELKAVLDERVYKGERYGTAEPQPQPSEPELPGGRFLVGLHGRADGPMEEPDLEVVRRAKIEAVKLLTTARPEDVGRLREIRSDMFIMARLFMSFPRDRAISPEEFTRAFRPNPPGQVKTDLQKFYDQGVRYFEIHNEPNLVIEGFGASWHSGAEFGRWFLDVVRELSEWFPEAKWGFPGLSPGWASAERPQDMWSFLRQAESAIKAADWLGVHQYFGSISEMRADLDGIVREYRRRWPDKLVMVTEFSNPYKGVPKETKGHQYVTYYRLVSEIPGVGAAFSFVCSASMYFEHESWREEDGRLSKIVDIVARR